ncbi:MULTISPECIES: RNA polymerase sigma factor [Microbacterium]|uniref:RNA polymerase sigma factor n=1 Tax=Microbacterium TaxID=33882 RepID=UPI0004049DE5|nr:sigma-70 family RNA polymerase sigma factor [Microbacterium sp. B24]
MRDLFDLHEARLFRQACRLLADREDAKDAVAIAFLEAWRKKAAVRLVDGSPLPWLLTTVVNASRNVERSRRRYRALLSRTPAAAAVGPPVAPDESGLLASLTQLPDVERSVVVLVVLEGYSEREAADALGIPVGTVKSRLSRAKGRLRDGMAALEASWT